MFTGLADPTLWVAVSFFALVAVLIYYKIPAKISTALDSRADQIRAELDEAKRLREEAMALLNEYKRKQSIAEQEAEEIVLMAQREAEMLAEETERKLTEQLERRTRQAEDKIARAQVQAMNEVRAAAVDASIAASGDILRKKAKGAGSDKLINQAISSIAATFAQS